MHSHCRPSKTTNHSFSLPTHTIPPRSSSCTTSTSRDDPSNDLKIPESFGKKPEKIWVPGKSHRLVKNINVLPDNVLLEAFDFYRESLCFQPFAGTTWKWDKLVHVCQRWRRIIFGSPRRLHLHLTCTRGTPVRKNLGCWPAFPLFIDYPLLGPDGEDNVIAALEHPDRVLRARLQLTHSQLRNVSTAVQGPFSALESLWLASAHGNAPILPDAFLGGSAPRLQNLYLGGIPFPALSTLLSSANDLVQLRLFQIPQTGYISPEGMVASLAALTRLETLELGFRSPSSRPSSRHPPPLTRTILPALTEFRFRGVSEYLEDLVAQINTPQLKDLKITYFNQLDFQVPQLSQFFSRQEILNPALLHNMHVEFSCRETRIKVTSSYQPPSPFLLPPEGPGLDLEILSEGIDWQASHLTQVLKQCFVVPPDVVHLSIGDGFSGPDEHDGMDDTEWLELLSLFDTVKSLLVSEEMAGLITHALDITTSEMVAEVLPALRLLHILPEYRSAAPVEQIISLRRLSSQPITIVNTKQEFDRLRPLLDKEEKVPDRLIT